MPSAPIYTIGHSNQDVATFMELLKDHTIQVVVDVRSAPYSRYAPQFNKREIETVVTGAGLKYIFMGDVIGGKPSEPQYRDIHGKVMYQMLALSDTFQQGLDRLTKGVADGWIIALMCAEADPLKCHRHLLIAWELELKRHIPVWHIRSDGTRLRAIGPFEENAGQLKLFTM